MAQLVCDNLGSVASALVNATVDAMRMLMFAHCVAQWLAQWLASSFLYNAVYIGLGFGVAYFNLRRCTKVAKPRLYLGPWISSV